MKNMSRSSLHLGAVAVAATLAGGLIACGDNQGAARASAPSADTAQAQQERRAHAPPATFRSLPPGWRQFNDRGANLTSRGATSETLATSWRFRQSEGSGPAGAVPPRGIFITVALIRKAKGGRPSPKLCRAVPRSPAYPRIRHLPLKIADASVGELEGNDRIPEYRLSRARRNDYYVEVRISINQAKPDRRLLREAQKALDQLRLPDWPNHC
jgi:hypothetical protein